jgi:hypothetical protein
MNLSGRIRFYVYLFSYILQEYVHTAHVRWVPRNHRRRVFRLRMVEIAFSFGG